MSRRRAGLNGAYREPNPEPLFLPSVADLDAKPLQFSKELAKVRALHVAPLHQTSDSPIVRF